MQDLISVIIPVYNTRRFIPQCLKSVINQDYKSLEIIIVNDASTDNSLSICKRFAEKDNRIKIIDKGINEGVELARKTGISIASGKYIMYVDSDDWLSNKNVISSMYRKAEETEADYVEIKTCRTLDKWGLINKEMNKYEISGQLEQPKLFDEYFVSFFGRSLLSITLWGKLYRKSFLDNIEIKTIGVSIGEDLCYNIQLFPYLKKIYIIDEPGYYYRYGGITSRFIPNWMSDSKKVHYLREELIEKYHYEKARIGNKKEFIAILKSDIQQRIRFKQRKEDIIKFLNEEIADPIYAKIIECYREFNIRDPFVMALQEKNVLDMYERCCKMGKKLKWRIKIINLASKVLNRF